MDITEGIERFARNLRDRDAATHTVRVYLYGLQRFQRYLAENGLTSLTQVGRQEMRDYHAILMAAPLAMETRAQHIRAVKRLFEYLTATYHLLINPTEGLVETCRRGRPARPVLTASA